MGINKLYPMANNNSVIGDYKSDSESFDHHI